MLRAPSGLPSANAWACPPDDDLRKSGWPQGWAKRVAKGSLGASEALWPPCPPVGGKVLHSMEEACQHLCLQATESNGAPEAAQALEPTKKVVESSGAAEEALAPEGSNKEEESTLSKCAAAPLNGKESEAPLPVVDQAVTRSAAGGNDAVAQSGAVDPPPTKGDDAGHEDLEEEEMTEAERSKLEAPPPPAGCCCQGPQEKGRNGQGSHSQGEAPGKACCQAERPSRVAKTSLSTSGLRRLYKPFVCARRSREAQRALRESQALSPWLSAERPTQRAVKASTMARKMSQK